MPVVGEKSGKMKIRDSLDGGIPGGWRLLSSSVPQTLPRMPDNKCFQRADSKNCLECEGVTCKGW